MGQLAESHIIERAVNKINRSMKWVIPGTALLMLWLYLADPLGIHPPPPENPIILYISCLILSTLFWGVVMIVLLAVGMVLGYVTGEWKQVEKEKKELQDPGSPSARMLEAAAAKEEGRRRYEAEHACARRVGFQKIVFGETRREALAKLPDFTLLEENETQATLLGSLNGEQVLLLLEFTPRSYLLSQLLIVNDYSIDQVLEKLRFFEEALEEKYGKPIQVIGPIKRLGITSDEVLRMIRGGEFRHGARWKLRNGEITCFVSDDLKLVLAYEHDVYERMRYSEKKELLDSDKAALSRSL